VLAGLDPSVLEGNYGIPSSVPPAFGPSFSPNASYAAFVTSVQSSISLLTVFIVQGLETLVEQTVAGTVPSSVAIALSIKIDGAYDPSLTPIAAANEIRSIVTSAQGKAARAGNIDDVREDDTMPASSRIFMDMRRVNMVTWFCLLGVGIVGSIALVVLKPGFGTVTDFLVAVVASFGVPAVGGSLVPSQSTGSATMQVSQAYSGSRGL
jgi:hypothetical protein